MNLYGKLIEHIKMRVEYCFGTDPEQMTGLLLIDLEKGKYAILKYPEEQVLSHFLHSFCGRILHECMAGNIKDKVSREIG